MKRLMVLSAVLCVCISVSAAPAGELTEPYLVNAARHGQTFRQEEDGALRVEFDSERHHTAGLYWKNGPALDPAVDTEAQLSIELENADRVSSISLHLRDAHREFFQFKPREQRWKDGVNVLSFSLREGLQRSNWGGGKRRNGRIDPPYYPAGVTVRLKPGSGRQHFRVLKLDFCTGGARVAEARREFIPFDDRGFLSGPASHMEISRGEQTTVVTARKAVQLKELDTSLRDFADVCAFEFLLEADTPGKLTVAGMTRTGKQVRFRGEFKKGKNKLRIPAEELVGTVFRFRLLGLSLPGKRKQSVTFIRSNLVQKSSCAAAIRSEVLTGNELHILKRGEEEALKLRLENCADRRIAGELLRELIHDSGATISLRRKFDLPAGGVQEEAVPFRNQPLGAWKVRTTVTADGGTAVSTVSFASLIPAGPTPGPGEGFLFGMCSHTHRWPERARRLEAEAAGICGVKLMRSTFTWGAMQPRPGAPDFSLTDAITDLYAEQNIEMLGGLGFVPRWAAPEALRNSREWRDWNRCMPPLDLWRKAVAAATAHYRGRIRFWRVWNEPDIHGFARFGSEDYVKLVKSAYEELKRNAPEARLIVGDFATLIPLTGRPKDNVKFQEESLAGARGFFDLHSHHEHGAFSKFAHVVDDLLLPLRRKTGTDVPWLAGETAIASTGGQERFQAETLYKKLIFARSRGAVAYLWYNLRNDGFDPHNGEHHYGMLTHDFYPKPVYSVYNMLARRYSGSEFVRQIPAGPGRWLFVFRKGDSLLLAGWNESGNSMPVPVVIRTDARSAVRIDWMDNETPVVLSEGTLIFELGSEPATLLLPGTTRIENGGELVHLAPPPAPVSGSAFQLELTFINPFRAPLHWELTAELPPEIRAEQSGGRLTLAPGEKRTATLNLTAGELPAVNHLRLRLRDRASGRECVLPVTLPAARRLSSLPFGRRAPDFLLNRQDQAVSRYEADPTKVHMLWQGPEDLSARLWLGAADETLRLRAVVRDDRHIQTARGDEIWRGDSLQFALQFSSQSGMWVLGAARSEDGRAMTACWAAPKGFRTQDGAAAVKLQSERRGRDTVYEIELPLRSLGISPGELQRGFLFNLLVNDDDGEGRKGWLQLAPGLGQARNPAGYPRFAVGGSSK